MSASLHDLMDFDHVVTSDGEGNVTDGPRDQYAPAPYVDLDADGQMISLDPADIYDLGEWRFLNGFSGQDRYCGPIMHESEYVGAGLERYIRVNAGHYVVVEVIGVGPDDIDEVEPVGWAVAYRDAT